MRFPNSIPGRLVAPFVLLFVVSCSPKQPLPAVVEQDDGGSGVAPSEDGGVRVPPGPLDTDGDGFVNNEDNCPDVPNPDQGDTDADRIGNACDNCPTIANTLQEPEVCESGDGDTWPDSYDNCPDVANEDQRDADGDGAGDACDNCPAFSNADQDPAACSSGDGDSIPDVIDNCPGLANEDQLDGDGDSVGDACDNCIGVANYDQAGPPGTNTGDACQGFYVEDFDTDGDGVPDMDDNCPGVVNPGQQNADSDLWGNHCDNCDFVDNPGQEDSDANGLGDVCDPDITDESICAEGDTTATAIRPNLYFLLDRSGSMAALDGGSTTRWARLITALDTISASLVGNFNLGLGIYPAAASCDAPNLGLVMGEHTETEFEASYPRTDPPAGRFTPTRLALATVLSQARYELMGDTVAGRPQAVVLMTDGIPNSAGAPSACSDTSDTSGALEQARALAALGVRVFVVGLSGVSETHMQDVANAGTPGWTAGDPNTPWYAASSTAEIVAAVDSIRAVAASCAFAISESGMPDYSRLQVILDANGGATAGGERSLGPSEYSIAGSTLTLSSSACTELQEGARVNAAAEVRLRVACVGPAACVPTGPEVCDYIDNDCDGMIDEGCVGDVPEICDGIDNDGDGMVDEGCGCIPAAEICDGIDNDCDGLIDEGCAGCRPNAEACDGIDNDCDGLIDEGCLVSIV